ncbi:TRAP transporter small permease [Pikeienuella sp. HZG-20]|uniref:TRAP transporter small permease n=1 Tax=Paludibacillus litoralis TaxID=3133267 RepID=UPI0030ED3987
MAYILSGLEKLLDALVVLGILFISGLVFSQFFSRYVLNFSLPWSEEVATFAMIWAGLLGLVGHLRTGDFISFNVLSKVRHPGIRLVASVISQTATVIFFLLILWLGLKVSVLSQTTGMSSAAQIPLWWVYIVYPVVAGGILIRLSLRWLRAFPRRVHHER